MMTIAENISAQAIPEPSLFHNSGVAIDLHQFEFEINRNSRIDVTTRSIGHPESQRRYVANNDRRPCPPVKELLSCVPGSSILPFAASLVPDNRFWLARPNWVSANIACAGFREMADKPTGSGQDIIAFNRGDGHDKIVASTGQDNTLSLGNGITCADLVAGGAGRFRIIVS